MRIIWRMRINLITPFAEKDAAKALGARWDSAQKVWYIVDPKDLTPFRRWIPNLEAATQDSAALAAPPKASTAKNQIRKAPELRTKPMSEVPHCGCDVLPWEHCQHSIGT